jgi:hypothetical protein
VPAAGARPRLATLSGRVLAEYARLLALRAVGVFAVGRVALTPQVLKASVIVGELAHELHQRVRGLGAVGSARCVSVNWRHNVRLPYATTNVKQPYIKIAALEVEEPQQALACALRRRWSLSVVVLAQSLDRGLLLVHGKHLVEVHA